MATVASVQSNPKFNNQFKKGGKRGKSDSVTIHDVSQMKLHRKASTLLATEGRDKAIRDCRTKVEKISRECRLRNSKYRDPHFDISERPSYCLFGLLQLGEGKEGVDKPNDAKRVGELFENPKFIVDGIDAGDIKQGAAGDCWFLAAVATIANMPGLLESICVARDEEVGVYGFIFFRDGEWISEVVDDQLFITHGDYYTASDDMKRAFASEEDYVASLQSGSKALHYAHCADSNETWLPLLEKAFAKVHGDYSAIEAGHTGEGVEDLTGGVCSEIICSDILDKERFWNDELSKVNKEFLFAGAIFRPGVAAVKGILTGHAYSVLKAVEFDGQRLVQVRNPWGQTEWTGAWSDGSSEWTAEWITKLDHKFGDDGAFWMSYADFLKTFTALDRTRVFTPEWKVAQAWTTDMVSWPSEGFSDNEFLITLNKGGPTVIVLSQADSRYFVGLDGEYDFTLHFRVRRDGEQEYYARSSIPIIMTRSVSTELNLQPGVWRVSYKISRTVTSRNTRTTYINNFKEKKLDKFIQVARNFDYAMNLDTVHAPVKEVEEEPHVVEDETETPEEGAEEEGNAEEESGEAAEEAAPEAEQQNESESKPFDLDALIAIGVRVYAKDPELSISLVESEGNEVGWELDPDDTYVKAFHAQTGNSMATITNLAL